jgi:hypothetical protein
MPKRRLWAVALAGIVAAGVGVFGLWLYAGRTAITEANAVRIRPGMTLAEIEGILGGPARDESTGPLVAVLPPQDGISPRDHEFLESVAPQLFRAGPPIAPITDWNGILSIQPGPRTRFWESNWAQIWAQLDGDLQVVRCDWQAVRRVYEHPLDRFRAWLGL